MSEPYSVRILSEEVLSDFWSTTKKLKIAYTRRDGREEMLTREVNDHGHGAAVLAIDPARGMVLLVKQMRIAALVAGHRGPMLEACAGLLDGDDPLACAIREGEEELGYALRNPRKICDAFASPGALTERLTLFIADYTPLDRVGDGGGLLHEGEDIEVIEMPLPEAYGMIASGGIMDAKTVILLQAAMLEKR
jgi:nudix-type nucleoside diphosphatase (YffH/AdpP family)